MFYRGAFNSYKSQTSREVLNESERRTKTFSASSYRPTTGVTVFLSHKHDELDLGELDGVIGMLRQYNVVPYIDSMDNTMPEHTNAETAMRIKEVIKFCDKFILLATNSAIESYWCNWEVGIGDVHKYKRSIALLPMRDNSGLYKGNEYLKLYSSIEYFDGTTYYSNGQRVEAGYYVRTPIEEIYNIEPLETWLNG
jgi:hypothetical protein